MKITMRKHLGRIRMGKTKQFGAAQVADYLFSRAKKPQIKSKK